MNYTFKNVFSFDNICKASKNCLLGVKWKPSTQNYMANELLQTTKLYNHIHDHKYKSKGFYEFDIYERGKIRHIQSLHIVDRTLQKCFCDYCLTPLITPKLIYDNGACLLNKGITFTRNRFRCHLQKYIRKNYNNGYILLFDFKSYFASVSHKILKDKINKILKDKDLQDLFSQLVDDFGSNKGLGLGSQISQISALFYLNDFDKYIKHKLKIKYYGRYMDDGYLIHESKEFLQYCLKELRKICESLDIKFNENKTQLVKLSNNFTFLKHKFNILKNGQILERPLPKTFIRERRKLKKISDIEIIKKSFNSWKSSLSHCKCYKSLKNMTQLLKDKEKELC